MKYILSIFSLVMLIGFTACNSTNSKQTKEQKTTEVTVQKAAPAASQVNSIIKALFRKCFRHQATLTFWLSLVLTPTGWLFPEWT